MSSRVPCVGGPADGAAVQAGSRYRWVDPETERGYADPAEGRALYRRRGGVYVFEGFTWAKCGNCQGYVRRREGAHPGRCPGCGVEID